MASAITTDFVKNPGHADAVPFALIEHRGLASRLIQAVEAAVREFSGDPRGFIKGLVWASARDAKRRQRIYAGLSVAVVAHAGLLIVIAVFGWRTMFVKPVAETTGGDRVIFPLISSPEKNVSDQPDVRKGEAGGGGGGQHSPLPPSKGTPPQMLPRPQIVKPNPSNVPEPTLAVLPTIVGPESPPPPPDAIGDPKGKGKDFSGGPGSGDGIGRGEGTGVGGGKDGGAGPGGKGGKGGGVAGSPDGSGSNVPKAIDFSRISSFPGYKTWSWIRRQSPIVTPEAQENKVMGNVALRANFNADGTITDIEVAMPVDFMTESAIEALKRSTFRPATINGVPVTVRRVLIKIFVHY